MSGSSASVAQPSANGEGGQESAQGNDAPGDSQAQPVALTVEQAPGPNEAAVAEPQAQTAQPDPYDLRDLVAQEQMAEWAFWVVVVAALTFIVTSIGTFLIWRQVRLTRQAVEDTGEATEAMREANEIARETQERQLRAYVQVASATLNKLTVGKKPSGCVVIRNSGQTPAHDVTFELGICAARTGAEESSLKNLKFEGTISRGGLGPGLELNSEIEGGSEWTADFDADFSGGGIKILLVGAVYYTDVFGNERETAFRFVHDHECPATSVVNAQKGNYET